MQLETSRLVLRPWRESDLEPLAALNADPEAMRHFAAPLTRAESDAFAQRQHEYLAAHGFCFWAVEAPGIAPLIGAVGIAPVRFQARFTPAVEIGWRLARPYWGQGFATEAARAALAYGFGPAGLAEIVAFTATQNLASVQVMERLGMRPDGDFDNPAVPDGHRVRRLLLYRIAR
ncbi:MAG: GNAT family N-acetyltransferase, partial [Proteobacteria bacterium]|nr:GNAT family N-acetyltransferase [Pseudomonadota bacterium]